MAMKNTLRLFIRTLTSVVWRTLRLVLLLHPPTTVKKNHTYLEWNVFGLLLHPRLIIQIQENQIYNLHISSTYQNRLLPATKKMWLAPTNVPYRHRRAHE